MKNIKNGYIKNGPYFAYGPTTVKTRIEAIKDQNI
jgi:hypothetical protein